MNDTNKRKRLLRELANLTCDLWIMMKDRTEEQRAKTVLELIVIFGELKSAQMEHRIRKVCAEIDNLEKGNTNLSQLRKKRKRKLKNEIDRINARNATNV